MDQTYHHLLQEQIKLLQGIEHRLPIIVVVHKLEDKSIAYMSDYGLKTLKTTLPELINLGAAYQEKYFNKDEIADYSSLLPDLLNSTEEDKILTYFQQARSSADEDWTWYLSSSKIFLRDANSNATHIITCAAPIGPKHQITSKMNRLLDENSFLRKNQAVFASLTKREKEILKFTALGETSAEIANRLHIAEQTAITHRRNIRAKLNAQSNYDFTRFAQAFNLI
ncbi:helix-turn-helix transcriptional regulator [Pedobacter sp. MC2016-24]|uniref:helix-turn-helix domain-containing protein n=1 Tax=Pedobacter sp. MC2016-24 TaxID=2780090 RepID=UPI00187EFD72|nr:helix-turn-helix transcriptional regulator [Pedobacter sp. MC2016-24]MBE9602379.1 helix-turn-helix transcriptional regulator [Pedobacter sp. MC2016-24]